MSKKIFLFIPFAVLVLVLGVHHYMPLLFSVLRRYAEIMSEDQTRQYVPGTHSIALVTVPTMEVAKIISKYEKDGMVKEDSELILIIKTVTTKINALTEFVRKHHPNDCAEVISSLIENGNRPYLDWISKTVLSSQDLDHEKS